MTQRCGSARRPTAVPSRQNRPNCAYCVIRSVYVKCLA